MAELPVRVEAVDDSSVRITVTCGECGALSLVTIADVPPFTRKVAQTMFQAATSSSTPRVTAVCGRCDRNAAMARR